MSVKRQLNEIISRETIKSVFQPIISLLDGSVLGHEALSVMTLQCDIKNIGSLFELGEKYNRVWDLELLCRSKALETAFEVLKPPYRKKLFVNVNPNIMNDDKFQKDFTKQCLSRYHITSEDIIFEITERTSIHDIEKFKNVIKHFKSQHYQIALDDVGAGYSGLNLIASVKPNYIKLDMELIRDIHQDYTKKAIVKSMVLLGSLLNIKLIAEGIESSEELRELIELGVHYGQGYYIQKPREEIFDIRKELIDEIISINTGEMVEFDHHQTVIKELCMNGVIVDSFMKSEDLADLFRNEETINFTVPQSIRNRQQKGSKPTTNLLSEKTNYYPRETQSTIVSDGTHQILRENVGGGTHQIPVENVSTIDGGGTHQIPVENVSTVDGGGTHHFPTENVSTVDGGGTHHFTMENVSTVDGGGTHHFPMENVSTVDGGGTHHFPTENVSTIDGVVIVENNIPQGIITKTNFFLYLGSRYGFSLNKNKRVSQVMDQDFLMVDLEVPIVEVMKLAMRRSSEKMYDFIVVTKENEYFGIVTIKDLLENARKSEVMHARSENPLTGLPGNVIIDKVISNAISTEKEKSIMYIDIDHFKAYNDVYGFKNGDLVIKLLADILKRYKTTNNFIGHIGGDDFVVICDYDDSSRLASQVIEVFDAEIKRYYDESDVAQDYFIGRTRQGIEERFPITSISIAAITNKVQGIQTIYDVTQQLAEIKKKCKKQRGSFFMQIAG